MKRLKVGIIGCGVIGGQIARACQDRLSNGVELAGICDVDEKKALALQLSLGQKVAVLKLDKLFKRSQLVVEAASAAISVEALKKAIKAKRDILIMSVGGLLNEPSLLEDAEKKGIKVFLPSGAICGIDGLKAMAIGQIEEVTITTRKPPKGLIGAPYLKDKGVDITEVTGESVVFDGNAYDAVEGFPQNINVCAILSLAGIGGAKTRVKILTSPDYVKNIHEVEIVGSAGRISTRTENVPSGVNPKTSELAVLSAIATLECATKTVRMGT